MVDMMLWYADAEYLYIITKYSIPYVLKGVVSHALENSLMGLLYPAHCYITKFNNQQSDFIFFQRRFSDWFSKV